VALQGSSASAFRLSIVQLEPATATMSVATDNNLSSARSSTLDGSHQGLIGLFDIQLKVLADSYLSFFQERYGQLKCMVYPSTHLFNLQEKDRRGLVSGEVLSELIPVY